MWVGIDQSYSGFAMTCLFENGDSKTMLRKFGPEKLGTGVNRLLTIDDWVQTTLFTWERQTGQYVRHVCMEGYANGVKFGREQSGELGATVKRAIFEHGDRRLDTAYPTIVPPTSLKKFVTGKGNAKKAEMLLGVYRKWGQAFEDDNKADSYGLAQIAKALDGGGHSDLAYEREVLEALTPFTERL